MNYIKEINAFYQRQETNPLSSNAANLWHTLMHVNNRAGWRRRFTVAISVLCSKANLSESTFQRARVELRDKGYVRYVSRGGNLAAMYEMVSCVWAMVGDSDVEESGLQSEVIPTMGCSAGTLVKRNETKQRSSAAADRVIHFFENNFGVLRPYLEYQLVRWVDVVGDELVLAAMGRALERGKVSWGYTKGILEDWLEKGVETVREVEEEVVVFRKRKQGKASYAGASRSESGSGEVIPDWFYERRKGEVDVDQEEKMETAEEAKERMEVEALLAKHASGAG